MSDVRLLYITAPSIEVARQLADQILTQRLVACVNILPGIESRYWWEEQIETASEVAMICKTTADKVAQAQKVLTDHHPYDIPSIIELTPTGIFSTYAQWIQDTVS